MARAGVSPESFRKERFPRSLRLLLAGFSSLRAVGLKASFPCWLLAGNCAQVLATGAIPGQLVSAEPARERSQPFVTSSQEWHPLNVAVFCWLKASYSSGRDYTSVYQEVRLSQAGFEAPPVPPTFRLSLSPLRPSFLFSLPGSFILLMYISVNISHRYLTSVCHLSTFC